MGKTLISRGFVKRVFLGLGAAGLVAGLCCIDGFFIEPHFPRVIRQSVFIEGLPRSLDGLQIVQLSDLHIVKIGKREERAIRIIDKIQPDLICLTGDYIEDDGITPGEHSVQDCIDQAALFVSRLRAEHGVFGIHGNWDPSHLTPHFERAGVRMIDNKSVDLDIRGTALRLSSDRGMAALSGDDRVIPTIVLQHIPDTAEDLRKLGGRVDLVLAGHWHGGQVGWPLRMNEIEHLSGLYRTGSVQLYVTRGLGMHSEAVRFNCPAEITLITLRTK